MQLSGCLEGSLWTPLSAHNQQQQQEGPTRRGDAHVPGPNNYNNLCHDAAALGLMAPSHGNNLTILWRLSGLCCGFLTNFLLTPTSATWVALSSSPPTS